MSTNTTIPIVFSKKDPTRQFPRILLIPGEHA
jgi:hypothetical protein